MCDLIVFAAYDVAPEDWADFAKTADLEDEPFVENNPAADGLPPYVLIYSRSQKDFSRTGDLLKQVKTDFSSSTYVDMYAFIENLYKDRKEPVADDPGLFMVLDEKSKEDRKVVLVSSGLESLYTDEEPEDGTDDNIWRKHRIPFEKVCSFWLVLVTHPGDEGDEFLQNTTRSTLDGL